MNEQGEQNRETAVPVTESNLDTFYAQYDAENIAKETLIQSEVASLRKDEAFKHLPDQDLANIALKNVNLLLKPFQDGTHDTLAKQYQATNKANRENQSLQIQLTEEKQRAAEAEANSERDHLTGLPNKRKFEGDLDTLQHDILRYPENYTDAEKEAYSWLVHFDIDHFKWINDVYGHAVGDTILKVVREFLPHTRATEPIYRTGGEEFMQILRKVSKDDLLKILQRYSSAAHELSTFILKHIDPMEGSNPDEILKKISLSFGIVQLNSHIDKEKLLKSSDEALYESKRTGRDRGHIYAGADTEGNPVFEYQTTNTQNNEIPSKE